MNILLILLSLITTPKQMSSLSRYDLANKNVKIITLHERLIEISGMAFDKNGRLFAHNDEKGVIYELDKSTGKILKSFGLGKEQIKGDFESLTTAGDRFYLTTSSGDILEFTEGKDGGRSLYNLYKTGLTVENDIEGLCYDAATSSLLLSCKGIAGSGHDGLTKTVYSFSLKAGKLDPKPRFVLDMKTIAETFKLKTRDIHPSDIAYNSKTGTFFVLAHMGKALIEITPTGEVLGAMNLPKSIHSQPEALAFTTDGTLCIASEGGDGDGTMVVYPMK